jgi:hypothetical protein
VAVVPPGPSIEPAPAAPATWTIPAPKLPSEIRTSEGRLNLVLQVLLGLNTFQVWTYMPAKWSGLAQAVIAAGYAWSRGQAKTGSAGLR